MGLFGKQAQGTLKYGKPNARVAPPRNHATSTPPTPTLSTESKTTGKDKLSTVHKEILDLLKQAPKTLDASTIPALSKALGVFGLIRLIKKIFFGFFILMIVTSFLKGARSETITGTASATIVDDIFTTSCTSLSFGKVEAGSGAGTITVSPQSKVQIGGDVKADKSMAKASTCSVRGKANANYRIKAPESLTFTVSGIENKSAPDTQSDLLVDDIQIISANTGSKNFTGRINPKGEDTLSISATIHVTENTTPGLYEGFIPVTVYY